MKPNPILRLLAAAALAAAPGAPSAQAIGSARGPVGRSGAAPAVVSVNLPDAAASLGGAAQTQLGIDPSLARSPSPAGDILVPAEPSLERLEALPLSTDPIGPADVPASTSEKNHPPAPVSGESGEKHASIERSPSQGREESPDDPEGHAREPEIRARLRASVQGLDGAPSAESNEDAWRRADFVEPQGSSPADPGAPAPPRVGLFHHEPGGERPFLGGTLAAQLGSNAMQVSVPLALLELSDSMSLTALATGGATFLDAVGTLAGAWLTERYGNRRVLTASTLVRAASLGTAAALSLAGVLTVPVLVAAVLVEGLARGVADTAQSTVPQSIARGDADALRHIYRRYHGTVEFGAIVGPLLVGTLILAAGMGWAAALAPAAFLVAATIYRRLPSDTQTEHGPEAPEKLGFKGALSIPWVRLALLATAFLTLYPLKGLLPAIFAEEALHSPPAAAWLAVLFGVGGFAGSYVSVHAWKRLGLGPLLALAALGSVILGLAWLPGAFLPAAVGVLLFSASNVVARVALSSELVTRYGASAPTVMGLTRFTVNASAIVVRMAVALAFALTASVMGGFTALAVGIAVVAAGLLWVGLRLSRR